MTGSKIWSSLAYVSELPDKIDDAPPAKAAPSVEALLKPKRKRKKYKDKRRRPPTGLKVGSPKKLSDVQYDELRIKLSECWGIVKTYKHYAPLWGVAEETIRKAIAEIQAEWAKARESVSAEERAAAVLEKMYSFVDKAYEAHRNGDEHALKAIPAALDRIARIEGAFAAEKKEITGADGAPLNIGQMSEAQVEARIAELMKKHGAKILAAQQGGT